MSIVDTEVEVFDADFYGPHSPFYGMRHHEPSPAQTTTATAYPGDVRLDDEASEDQMNADVRHQVHRLRCEVPYLERFGITPGLHWSGTASELTVDALPWKVNFEVREIGGTFGMYGGEGPTLGAAMDAAIANYQAVFVPVAAGEMVAA